jgi:hypothetical protein
VIYDVLLIGQATAKANARDIIEPWDPPITPGLQECMHQSGRIDNNIELRSILDSLAAWPPVAFAPAGVIVAVVTAAALPARRVWPGPVFVWTLLAAAVIGQLPDRGALFPVALAISLYTVAATMRLVQALAAAGWWPV